MQPLKRLLEWYLGVPAAGPGEGTAWDVSFRTPWPAWVPEWCVLLLLSGLVALVVWIYRRDAATVSAGKRLVLVSLRLAVLAMMLLFLSGLTLSIDRTGLPSVAVLIDDSASMGLEDQYEDEAAARRIRELLGENAGDEPTRLNLVQVVLTREQAGFLQDLLEDHRIRLYRFSDSAVSLGRSQYLQSDQLDELASLIRDLKAEGRRTRPGPAVQKVLNDFRGTSLSSVVIFTDGVTSTVDSDRLIHVAEAARSEGVPVFTVGVGSAEPTRDLELYDVLVNEVAFVEDPLNFSGKLKGYGYAGRRVSITLRQQDTDRILAETRVRLAADGRPARFELTHTPSGAGEFDYVLEAGPLPKESNTHNNSETRRVSVREEKIRVLLAESRPRYEFRYVKHLLERERTVELDTVLQEADMEYAGEDETALEHFPVRGEALHEYDVVIFGDLNPAYLSSGVLDNLRTFVRDKGGGLIMVAGTAHNPLAYRQTPLESLLPVQLDGVRVPDPEATIAEGFRPRLTLEGRKGTSLFRFADSEEASLQVWRNLPKLYWLVEAPSLKPGAVVLAEHPTRSGADGRLPVICMQRFGAGKVLFHGTDALWRWRFRVGDRYYGRYWVQAVRYLSRSKLLGKDRTAELSTDRQIYRRGDTVHLRARFYNEQSMPAGDETATVAVERQAGSRQSVELSHLPEAPTVFEGDFPAAAEGSYHAWIVSPSFEEAPPAVDFRVEAPRRELRERSLNRAELVQTAEQTGGRYVSIAEAEQLPKEIPPGRPVALESQDPLPLWNRWEFLLLFAGLLTAEWLLRKRERLV